MDCASPILPITPPAELAAHIRTGSRLSCCAVIRCKLPNSAFDEASLPVRATPSQPRYVPKKGNSQPVRVRSEEHTSELQSQSNLVCRLLLETKHPMSTRVSPKPSSAFSPSRSLGLNS